jgi:hypothetical protein
VTFRVYLAGAEIDPFRVTITGLDGITENADGTTARSGIVFDDPDGGLDLTGYTTIAIEEDDCSFARLFTGYVISRSIQRGPYRSGASRIWDCDLIDLNDMLHQRILRGTAAKRPQETGSDRLDWLLATTGMAGRVFDNGFVMNNAWIYGPTDYRGQYADDVLRDIVSAASFDRWTFFLYWDDAAASGEEVSLFYNDTTDAINDSTLRISNLIADESSTTIYPFVDAALERDPAGQYGGVYTTGSGFAPIYRTKAATIAAMGLTRDATYTSARLNSATASNHTDGFLNWHSIETDRITCTVQLPSTQANLIRAGMRVQVKFTHLDGYEAFTWVRVTNRSVNFVEGRNDWYEVRLELSVKGVLQSGGGDPGGLPLPPPDCTTPSVVQFASAQSSSLPGDATLMELPDPPTAGNTLVLYATLRNVGIPALPSGWTTIDTLTNPNPGVPDGGIVAYRMVGSGESEWIEVRPTTGGGTVLNLVEIAGTITLGDSAGNTEQPASGVTTVVFAAVTPPAGSAAIVLGFHMDRAADLTAPLFSPAGGWTEIVDTYDAAGGGHPQDMVLYQAIATASGSYTPNATYTGAATSRDYANLSVAFVCSAADNPPAPGQWFPWTVVTMTGATGTAPFPYAAGSLEVKVDGSLISPASYTETDPATGEFTLSWTPDADEVVTVRGQGI